MHRFSEVDGFLQGKMQWRKKQSGHIIYKLPETLSKALPMVFPITLKHAEREVSPYIIRQIAAVLGVTSADVSKAFHCGYGDTALYASLLVAHIERLLDFIPRNPVVQSGLLESYCMSIHSLLASIRATCRLNKHHREDAHLLGRLKISIEALKARNIEIPHSKTKHAFQVALSEIDGFIDARLKEAPSS